MRYTLTEPEVACAKAVAGIRMRSGGATFSEKHHLENVEVQAAAAEITVSQLLNVSWSGCVPYATDVGKFAEVRSISDPDRALLVRARDFPDAFGKPVILVYVNGRNCEIKGWEFAEDVKANGRPMGEGDRLCWLLPQKKLRHYDELVAYKLEWIWSTN